ncbi:MAG: hypothetical protein IAE78_33315 [Myxococcus sp.]|nr:hypothetical protein [Myxococcus sp.]
MRLRLLMSIAVAGVGAGCTFGAKTCGSDALEECGAGNVCVQGFCVAGDGGLAAGGGGGSVAGGSAAGGSAAGGSAAGGSAAGGSAAGGSAAGGSAAGGSAAGGSAAGGAAGGCACAAGQACVLGLCENRVIALRLSAPSVIGAATSPATGRIDADAGTVLPSTVEVFFNGVGPTAVAVDSAGLFGFGLRGPPGQNRVAGLTVSVTASQGRLAADAGVVIDTPPLVEIEPRPAAGRTPQWEFPDAGVTSDTYRLTDLVRVRVTTEAPLPVDVTIGAKPAVPVACANCTAPGCGCFEAIPEDVSVKGLTRPVSVFALLRDGGLEAGLAADGGAPSVLVTRLRWRQRVPSGVVVAPLLDDHGTLFVAGDSFDGGLFAFTPEGDPYPLFQANVAGNLRSLALWRVPKRLDDDVIYFASNLPDGGGLVGALLGGSGGTIATHQTARATSTALALAQPSPAAPVTPIVRFSASPPVLGGLLQWNPDGGPHSVSVMSDDTVAAPFSATSPITPQLVVSTASGQSHFAIANGTSGGFVSRRDLFAENAFSPRGAFGGPFGPSPVLGLGVIRSSPSTEPGLVVSSGGLRAQPSGVLVAGSGPVVVDDSQTTWSHDGTNVVVTDFGMVAAGLTAFPGPVHASPLLGQRGAKFDHAYFVNAAGRLGAFFPPSGGGAGPVTDWAEPLPLSGQVVAPLTLDCDRSGSPYSFLYVATTAGDVLSVIAPSQKLAVDAPWPKFQRDVFNSGNVALPHSNCP